MIKVVSNSEMQKMDSETINNLAVPGIVLMENAGFQVFQLIQNAVSDIHLNEPIFIFCGKGNNGGDGYVIARHLFNAGFNIEIYSVGNPEDLKGDARTNYNICKNFNLKITEIKDREQINHFSKPPIIVDALLGTGIKGAVSGLYTDVIEFINKSSALVFSVDIPSGINGDSAHVAGVAVQADITVTMALPKRAHIFYPAKKLSGNLRIVDIGIPYFLQNDKKLKLNLVEEKDIHLPVLDSEENKYSAGTLFILAGSPGMTGAPYLSAAAALRTGTGLINIGIPHSLNSIMETKITEALTVPLAESEAGGFSKKALPKIENRIKWADAVLIGPGAGREEETIAVLIEAIKLCKKLNKPTLLDADALFALSKNKKLMASLNSNFILTPHYGEFIRLSGDTKEKLLAEPWDCLQKFLNKKNIIVNLKGSPSMVGTADGQLFINSTGNEGLAKGGSGDVLAGLIGGLMARGMTPHDAAICGNYLHGKAADNLTENFGKTAQTPGDLLTILPTIIKNFEKSFT